MKRLVLSIIFFVLIINCKSQDYIAWVQPNVAPVDSSGYGALYNWPVTQDSRHISSSDEWVVPDTAKWAILLNSVDTYDIIESNWPLASKKLRESGIIHWNYPNDATDDFGFSAIGSGERDFDAGEFGGINSYFTIWLNNEFDSFQSYQAYLEVSPAYYPWEYDKKTGKSIRLCNPTTIHANGYVGTYTQNDGAEIPTIVINGVEWTMNLKETKWRDGTWIAGYDGGVYTPISNADWVTRGTAGEALMCFYNNDPTKR